MAEIEWTNLEVDGGQKAATAPGLFEAEFIGTVEAAPMRTIVEAAIAIGDRVGVGAPRSVMVVDLSRLEAFSPEARKVFGMIESGTGRTRFVNVIVSGATLRTKALFALVVTATKLLGDVRIELEYAPSKAEARARAAAIRDEHIAAGRLALR